MIQGSCTHEEVESWRCRVYSRQTVAWDELEVRIKTDYLDVKRVVCDDDYNHHDFEFLGKLCSKEIYERKKSKTAKKKKRWLISAFLPSSFKVTRQGRHQMLKEEMV